MVTGAVISLMMAVIWTITSTMLVVQFIDYCDQSAGRCKKYNPFYYVVIISGLCTMAWVSS